MLLGHRGTDWHRHLLGLHHRGGTHLLLSVHSSVGHLLMLLVVLGLLLVLTVLLVLAILRTLLGGHSCSTLRLLETGVVVLLEAIAVVTGRVHLLMTSFTLKLAHQHTERSD